MILSYKTLRKLLTKNKLIKNFSYQNLHSSSYDVTTDKFILKFKDEEKSISLIDAQELDNLFEVINISEGYKLKPGECIIVVLEDEFNLPNNICGQIRGRTSFNRLGITLPTQHLNPGFMGKLNLTIINNSPITYTIMPKMQIAQVVFEKLDRKVKKEYMYSHQKHAVYQQKDGIQGSKVYYDFIGKVVRHFKGNYYYIDNICIDSETKEYTIIYRNLYEREDSNIWARPAKMFFEEIDPDRKDNVTKQKHRFEVVDDLTIDYTKKEKETTEEK